MRGVFDLSGIWSLESSYASRMWGIAAARMEGGKEPFSAGLFGTHPATAFQTAGQVAAGGGPLMAGSVSYYQYVVSAYTTEGVLVLPLVGALSRYGNCGWGYEDLAAMLYQADRMEEVKAILIKADTPGGAVDGLKAMAEAVRASKKPVLVWTNFCASAGYFIASQALEIWVEDQTLPAVGSIGTLMMYTDRSKALKLAGLEVEIMRATASTDKATANGIEPLTPEVRAEIQTMLDDCQKEFAGYVRRGRMGKLTSDEWTTAKMYRPGDAIRIGLADKKGSFGQAFKRALELAA